MFLPVPERLLSLDSVDLHLALLRPTALPLLPLPLLNPQSILLRLLEFLPPFAFLPLRTVQAMLVALPLLRRLTLLSTRHSGTLFEKRRKGWRRRKRFSCSNKRRLRRIVD